MAHNVKGSKFHPARISGRQKLIREREANKMLAENKKKKQRVPLISPEEFFGHSK